MSESVPESPQTPEVGQEKAHSKQEALAATLLFIKDDSSVADLERAITLEKGDEKGLYLLEITKEGEKPGETIEYRYTRAGHKGVYNSSEISRLDVAYYDAEGAVKEAVHLALFDEKTGKWKPV